MVSWRGRGVGVGRVVGVGVDGVGVGVEVGVDVGVVVVANIMGGMGTVEWGRGWVVGCIYVLWVVGRLCVLSRMEGMNRMTEWIREAVRGVGHCGG